MAARSILHCDLDAFYASVEQVDRPELRGQPVIVGGDPHKRGVVAAASYEARRFGVHSAMPLATAVRLCPHGQYVRPRFDLYRDYSQRVFDIYQRFTPLVEPLSLDEAFLDLTGTERATGSPRDAALRIRDEVKGETQLDVSIGIGACKVVAKIASDLEKPRGLVEVEAGQEEAFLAPLPARRLPGLGPSTERRLEGLGLRTIGDIARLPLGVLTRQAGKSGLQLWQFAHGIDDRPVLPPGEPKSISRETTFEQDLIDPREIEAALRSLARHAASDMRHQALFCRTLQLKLRYSDFSTYTRSRTLPFPTNAEEDIVRGLVELFRDNYQAGRRVRLIGAGVTGFSHDSQQLGLFDAQPAPQEALNHSLDRIRGRFGWRALTVGPAEETDQRDWRRQDLPAERE